MPTPITPTFTPLTDARIWFANVAAFNNFISGISFTVGGSNLPAPTATTLGGVMWLEIGAFVAFPATSNYVTITMDDGATQATMPARDAYDSLVNRVSNIENWALALYNQLLAKGYVAV